MRFSFFVLPALLLGVGFEHSHPDAPAPPAPVAPASNGTRNLASLWQPGGENEIQVHNGFFDKSRQRLELVFTSVQRDARNPRLYHVQGKDRRFRKVQRFDGTFSFDKVDVATRDQGPDAKGAAASTAAGLAVGTFVLREKASARDREPGTFQGKIAVDFLIEENKLVFNSASSRELTRRAGMLLEGRWTSATDAGYSVPVLVQEGTSVINAQLMPNFEIGDRGGSINPRYTRVGWDTYWENVEWWAEKSVSKR